MFGFAPPRTFRSSMGLHRKAATAVIMLLFASMSVADPLTTCGCTSIASEQWSLPASNASSVIASKADASQCWQLTKTSGSTTCDGLCVVLGPCTAPDTPTWTINAASQRITVTSPAAQAGWCLDQNTAQLYIQAYPQCISGDTHQLWSADGSNRIHELWTGEDLCVGSPGPASVCPPPPAQQFCYQYHAIHASGLYDPSGPLLAPDGRWHVWEDAGGWSHYVSTDLLRWSPIGPPSTNFDGLTGSIAVTPGGIFAFWPTSDQSGVLMAQSTDPVNLTTWSAPTKVIDAPPMAGANFRDPLRAFEWQGAWYVGVGCNNASQSADLCLFQASDDTLSNFSYVGTAFHTNVTYGQMNSDIVWTNTSVQATMMECPDIFPLGSSGKWMLMGSLFSTNQWWVGTMAGSPPTFTPDTVANSQIVDGYGSNGQVSVGMVDWGNGYAAKTGSTYAAAGGDRRVLFAFTGWNEPTADSVCGRAFIIPRDLTLGPDGSSPKINPIPELTTLQVPGSLVTANVSGQAGPAPAPVALATGSQLMVSLVCTLPAEVPTNGSVYLRLLSTVNASAMGSVMAHGGADADRVPADEAGTKEYTGQRSSHMPASLATARVHDGVPVQYTEVGFDFSSGPAGALYADHSACCAQANSIAQRAYLANGAWTGQGQAHTADGCTGDSCTDIDTDTASISTTAAGSPVLNLNVLVDGGLIEAFANGQVTLTAMVDPDPSTVPAQNRAAMFVNNGGSGVDCNVSSWQMASLDPAQRLGSRGAARAATVP